MSTVIAKIDRSIYKTEINVGNHFLVSDEPVTLGQNLGPTPYDFLLISLGSCVAMTLRMYADRKGWDMEEVEVHLTQSRVHAKDCEDCESENGFVHLIQKKLRFKGSLDNNQTKRLLEIAEKCPVHKTLLNETKISTELLS